MGESGVEASGRRGLRLREIQIITEITKDCFPSPVNFVSPLFQLPSCQIHSSSRRVLSSLLPGLPLQILSQFDFFTPSRCLTRLPPLFTSPQTHSPSSRVSSSSFISICCLLFCISFSPSRLRISLRPINNSCLTVDSLTPIKSDAL